MYICIFFFSLSLFQKSLAYSIFDLLDKNIQSSINNVLVDPLSKRSESHSTYHHPAAPIISYQDRSVLNSTSILHSSINYRLCPYCARPLWVPALQYHIESSCPKAPPLPKLVDELAVAGPLENSNQSNQSNGPNGANGTKKKKRQSMSISSSAAPSISASPVKKRKIETSTSASASNTNSTSATTAATTNKDNDSNEKISLTQSSSSSKINSSSSAALPSSADQDAAEDSQDGGDGSSQTTPRKKVRKFNMTKQRKLALAAAQAEAIARGEKPPTIDQLDLAKITKKSGKKPKKSKEKEKVVKPKAPVDVEKQCGVPLANGMLCARSLTCKTHSMNAKRAVRGRSDTYDVLLANYQKLNQVKQASLSTAQQLANENEALGGSEIDPEEEVRQVMEGVLHSSPVPLEQKVIIPTRLKNSFIKMRELLAGALLPRGVRPLGGFLGRSLAMNPDNPTDIHYIRPVNQVLKQQKLMQLHAQRQAQARTLAAQQQSQQAQQQGQQQASTATQQQAQLAQSPEQKNSQQLNPQQQQQLLQYKRQMYLQRQMLQQQQQQQSQQQQQQQTQ